MQSARRKIDIDGFLFWYDRDNRRSKRYIEASYVNWRRVTVQSRRGAVSFEPTRAQWNVM